MAEQKISQQLNLPGEHVHAFVDLAATRPSGLQQRGDIRVHHHFADQRARFERFCRQRQRVIGLQPQGGGIDHHIEATPIGGTGCDQTTRHQALQLDRQLLGLGRGAIADHQLRQWLGQQGVSYPRGGATGAEQQHALAGQAVALVLQATDKPFAIEHPPSEAPVR